MKRSVCNNIQKLREGSDKCVGKGYDATKQEEQKRVVSKEKSHENLNKLWSICLVIPPASTPIPPGIGLLFF